MSVRREVSWPVDTAAVARSLARSGAWCWLDGEAEAPDEAPGRSYLGAASEVRIAECGEEGAFLAGLRARGGAARAADDVSGGFSGGWVTALSYEFGVALLGLPPAADDAAPGFALRLDAVLVLDHSRGVAELCGESEQALDDWLAAHGGALGAEAQEPAATQEFGGGRAVWRRSAGEYRAQVEACRAAIRDGEAYVLCLTDTAELRGTAVEALELYLRLRAGGIAARGGVVQAGDRALVSASPERFLSVRGDRVSTHPIKGTRPRGADAREDARLGAELADDPKERAENLMIVDLMRNDLSRVCEPGTVAVDGFLRVESHPRVHQLVSTVTGRLTEGLDAVDVIEVCFPGGSMTGAPKRRAVEILAGLERAPRGLYSGCFGWIDRGGDAELAMSIRGVELRGIGGAAPAALVGAGGGITVDSDAGREHGEKLGKAAPMLRALGVETA
ncbi:MAG: anthranilate synthase component I family protein [Leucobacter sp.]